VVAIILIIAAIAIPNLLRARMAANESSAVSSIRTINTAEVTYNSTYPTTGFAANLVSLGAPSARLAFQQWRTLA
jgi:type IV pilus assembly protein PilA